MKIKIRSQAPLLTSFEMQSTLNSSVWDDGVMRPAVSQRLRQIAEEFIEKLDIPGLEIMDIILTGSLAHYNWSKYSDLDVHIIVDFKAISDDEGFVKKYFDAVRSNWNRRHDITVKGFEVELYIQDDDEKHESTGIYSLLHNEWLAKPMREEQVINKAGVHKKSRHLVREIDKVANLYDSQRYEKAIELGNQLKKKIKRMRQSGLERAGISSTENLAFKVLRRSGYMKKLFDTVNDAYDRNKSLAEQE
jgi:predicted nucleotidyltransferase